MSEDKMNKIETSEHKRRAELRERKTAKKEEQGKIKLAQNKWDWEK